MLEYFISYNSADEIFAQSLERQLHIVGFKTFYAPFDTEPGTKWRDTIKKRLEEADGFILIWSAAAAKSKGVADEVQEIAVSKKEKAILIVKKDDTKLPGILGDFQVLAESDGEDITRVLEGLLRTTVRRVEDGNRRLEECNRDIELNQRRVQKSKRLATMISTILAVLIIGLGFTAYNIDFVHNAFLEYKDSSVFNNRKPYYIARVFPDRASIKSQANFKEIFDSAQCSFNLIGMTGTSLSIDQSHGPMLKAIKRGVKVRVILVNPESKSFELSSQTVGDSSSVEVDRAQIQENMNLFDKTSKDSQALKGSFEYRLMDKQLLWSGWMMDSHHDCENAEQLYPISQASISTYSEGGTSGAGTREIAVMFGKESSDVTQKIQHEFNYIWKELHTGD